MFYNIKMKALITLSILAGLSLAIQTTGRVMQHDLQLPQQGKKSLKMDDPCDMLMMPMLFEMGHDVIYLFRG
jgi:hypothetical protein